MLLINQSHLSIAKPALLLNSLIHICHTHLYNWSAPTCYSITAPLNDCCSELASYTALAYCYCVSFHDLHISIPRPHPLMMPLLWLSIKLALLVMRSRFEWYQKHHMIKLFTNKLNCCSEKETKLMFIALQHNYMFFYIP